MQELDFGDYKLKWNKQVYPTPGALGVCQSICMSVFYDAGLTGKEKRDKITLEDRAKAQIANKKILDNPEILSIIDEVFDVSEAQVVGDDKYQDRNKIPLSQVLNAPVIEGSGIDFHKLIKLRGMIVNFLSVG